MGDLRRPTDLRQVELVDAALRIIETQGITALTTRRLAAEVGLTSGAIFRHFPSLDALLEAVIARVEAVLESTYPPPEGSAVERLEGLLLARSQAVGRHLGILRLVLSEQFLLALPQSGSERLTACVEKTQSYLHACLREGQVAGALRGDVPAEVLVPIVMGTVQVLACLPQAPPEVHRVVAGLLALLRPPTPGGPVKLPYAGG